jgi:hypothetical protein
MNVCECAESERETNTCCFLSMMALSWWANSIRLAYLMCKMMLWSSWWVMMWKRSSHLADPAAVDEPELKQLSSEDLQCGVTHFNRRCKMSIIIHSQGSIVSSKPSSLNDTADRYWQRCFGQRNPHRCTWGRLHLGKAEEGLITRASSDTMWASILIPAISWLEPGHEPHYLWWEGRPRRVRVS